MTQKRRGNVPNAQQREHNNNAYLEAFQIFRKACGGGNGGNGDDAG
jgi:hypothetical protein